MVLGAVAPCGTPGPRTAGTGGPLGDSVPARAAANKQVGETAMIALALIKADTPKTDPVLASCIAKIQKRFTSSGYSTPSGWAGTTSTRPRWWRWRWRTWTARSSAGEIGLVASLPDGPAEPQRLVGLHRAGLTATPRSRSTPCSGSGRARTPGVDVPPAVWDRAAGWFLSVQGSGGSWNYHRDEPQYRRQPLDDRRGRRQPADLPAAARRGIATEPSSGDNPLLTPLTPENSAYEGYQGRDLAGQIDAGGQEGDGLARPPTSPRRTSPSIGQSIYYGLYGIERIGALADRQTLGGGQLVREGPELHPLEPAAGRVVALSPQTDEHEHGLGDPVPDQVDGQVDPADRGQAARRGDAARAAASCPRTCDDDRRRRAGREPADERRGRGDARRARGPAGPGRRHGPRRAWSTATSAKARTCSGRSRTGSASC